MTYQNSSQFKVSPELRIVSQDEPKATVSLAYAPSGDEILAQALKRREMARRAFQLSLMATALGFVVGGCARGERDIRGDGGAGGY